MPTVNVASVICNVRLCLHQHSNQAILPRISVNNDASPAFLERSGDAHITSHCPQDLGKPRGKLQEPQLHVTPLCIRMLVDASNAHVPQTSHYTLGPYKWRWECPLTDIRLECTHEHLDSPGAELEYTHENHESPGVSHQHFESHTHGIPSGTHPEHTVLPAGGKSRCFWLYAHMTVPLKCTMITFSLQEEDLCGFTFSVRPGRRALSMGILSPTMMLKRYVKGTCISCH